MNVAWLVSHWRLKLLALVLALGLLAAVAFSENPLTVRSVDVQVRYIGKPPDLVLVSPPNRVSVSVIGLADSVGSMGQQPGEAAAVVYADVSHVRQGQTVVTGTPRILISNVNAQTDHVSIPLNVDTLVTGKQLSVEVRTPKVSAGWTIDRAVAAPSKVTLDGPESLVADLKAFVQLDAPVENGVIDSPNQLVQFEQRGKKIDLHAISTTPAINIEPSTVLIHVEARQPKQTRNVFLSATVTGIPAPGFAIRSVTVDPTSIDITGPGDVIGKLSTITLSPVSVDGFRDGTQTLRANVQLPDQVDSGVRTARVIVTVYALPVTQPTPPPPPTPRPSPSPSP
jgi:YbbR domain-containing protein